MATRLESWDYSSNGIYFVTFCTYRRKYLFGNVEQASTSLDSPRMILSDYGRACKECIETLSSLHHGVAVEASIVMPNHVHLLIGIEGANPTGYRSALSRLVGGLKAATTKALRQQGYNGRVWQAGFYDHVCRDEADYQRIYRYIEVNPSKWLQDRFFE